MSLLQTTARRAAGLIGRESWLIQRMRPAYESFLDWSNGSQGMPWEINEVTYRIDPHHRHRLGQNYDAPVAAFLRQRAVASWKNSPPVVRRCLEIYAR